MFRSKTHRPSSGQSLIQKDPVFTVLVWLTWRWPEHVVRSCTSDTAVNSPDMQQTILGYCAKQTGLKWLLTNVEIAYLVVHEHRDTAVLFWQLSGLLFWRHWQVTYSRFMEVLFNSRYLTLKEEHRKMGCCWGCLGRRGRKWQGTGDNNIMCSFMIGSAHRILLKWWSQRGSHWSSKGEARSGLWRWNLKERDYMEDLGVDGRIISTGVVKELGGEDADWIIGWG